MNMRTEQRIKSVLRREKKKRHAQVYFFAGLWFSFIAIVMGASTLLPVTKELSQGSPALLYKVAMNEQFVQPINMNVPRQGKFIVADLDGMQLSLYDGATLFKSFPILSRGREGTFWETPTGKYTIQTKEQKHFSSIGGTWMPYSMQFYGNFFIHGWPIRPDGAPVPKGYSGGCIRLSISDAGEVYAFTDIGTRVFVVGGAAKESFATSSRYYLHGEGKLPPVGASAFLVSDLNFGTVLWERNANALKRLGSLVALPTALTALETVNQYKIVRMGELLLGRSILRKYSVGALDELPAGTLVYPLLFDTNDTAGKVFAREHGTKQFVSYMNQKASAIGMEQTMFGGALSDQNSTTTARDLFTLLQYVDKNKHYLIDVTLASERVLSHESGEKRYSWENKNPWILSGDGAYRGGVAAIDADGKGSAMILFATPVAEFSERTVAFILLDSPDLMRDVATLRAFVADHYVYGMEKEEGRFVREPDEPTPMLLHKVKTLQDLEKLLQDDVFYERDVS
jgi:hypothetical protein